MDTENAATNLEAVASLNAAIGQVLQRATGQPHYQQGVSPLEQLMLIFLGEEENHPYQTINCLTQYGLTYHQAQEMMLELTMGVAGLTEQVATQDDDWHPLGRMHPEEAIEYLLPMVVEAMGPEYQ